MVSTPSSVREPSASYRLSIEYRRIYRMSIGKSESTLNAVIGSTRAARRARTQPASRRADQTRTPGRTAKSSPPVANPDRRGGWLVSARTDPIPLARTRGGGWSDTGRRWCRSCRAPRRFAVWPALSWMPHISSESSAGSWTLHPTGGGPSSTAYAFRLASPGRRTGTFKDRPVRRCAPASTYPRRGPATIELGAAQRDIEDPCTPAFALDPAARRMPIRRSSVRTPLLVVQFHPASSS